MKSEIAKTIGLAAIVASCLLYTGCNRESRISNSSEATKTDPENITLVCKPLTVANAYAHGQGSVAVTYENEGRTEVAVNYGGLINHTTKEVASATALIEKEINDKDQDAIKLYGNYKGKVFEFKSIDVEGNHVNF